MLLCSVRSEHCSSLARFLSPRSGDLFAVSSAGDIFRYSTIEGYENEPKHPDKVVTVMTSSKDSIASVDLPLLSMSHKRFNIKASSCQVPDGSLGEFIGTTIGLGL